MATEIICGILQTLITEIGKKLVHKIKNQLTHLCCYHFYIQRLTEEVQKLEIERQTVQQAVDVALRNLESIRPDVKDWLTRADDWLITSHEILDKVRRDRNSTTGKSCFLRWLPMVHYSLSVEAQKEVDALVQLQIAPGRFDRVSDPLNPADLQPVPPSTSEILLGSRALLEKQVMDALEDDVVYLIGLCGMGGVGKTTMATQMKNWAKSSSMFEVVIFTVISQRLDIKEVQKQIAEGLGLTLRVDTQLLRAEKIHARLKAAKSFLIIFDDVWERLDLVKIGIPSKSTNEKRKLILTSRNRQVLTTLTNDCYTKIFLVDVLPNDEAWKLFRETAGDTIEEPELVETAIQVSGQCKGLPLALVVVGSALRDMRKSMWEDALVHLKRSHMPSYIPGVLKDLYVPLKWSYEQLSSEELRYIFLLCCLFPEDEEIPIERLVRYGWGLHVFNDVETIREARNQVSSLVHILKSRFLLTQGQTLPFFGTEECVKVHDIIRDMGMSIACEDRYVFMISQGDWPRKSSYENITHIYVELKGKPALPETLNCPRLEFLHIENNSDLEDIPEKFFSCLKGLKVFSASRVFSTMFPSSILMLTNLQAINLIECTLDKMESVFGNMVNLEIISLESCKLDVLPREIGQLKNLKVLDLTDCENMSIESGVISKLVKLEELLMGGCDLWEAKEEEAMMVLAEISSLNSLVNLQIGLLNPKLLSLDQTFPPKLERFVLLVGGDELLSIDSKDFEGCNLYKVAFISCKVEAQISNFFLAMIRNVEGLMMQGDGCIGILNELGNIKFEELKLLYLADFGNAEYLVIPTVASQSQRVPENKCVHFPALESLFLESCENLKEICSHQPYNGSFGSLKQLVLKDMDNLIHALPVSKFHMCSHLEVIKIIGCPVMEHIFWEQQQEEQEQGGVQIVATYQNKIKFLRLRKLKLNEIPEMEVFCKGVEEIELPALEKLRIIDLPKMTNFASTSNCNINDDQFFFCKKIICPNLKTLELQKINSNGIFNYNIPKGYFNWLEDLRIYSCNNLKNVMAPSLSKSLKNLKILCIVDCKELEEVIICNQDEEGQTNNKKILFPQLRSLYLLNLPKIHTFCHMTTDLELPSLEFMTLERCPLLKTFSLGSLSCPKKQFEEKDYPALANQVFFKK